jgi:rhamnopyranosyl-N-acetylglucosaminyl-diphospho-decaprenol beta-1,3/1,4-galactofuranosyltransferase
VGSDERTDRVVAVVVSYNREKLLEETLSGLAGQGRPVDAVVVVDNASTDGALDVALRLVPAANVVALTRNTGGAGGFAVGIAEALRNHTPDWVWVMDDDTVPRPGALAAMLDALKRHPDPSRVAALGSRVVWTDGRDHPMNTPRVKPFVGRSERSAALAARATPIRSISFVSSMFRAESIREEGLPIADYFLWNDDFEFSARLLRKRWGVAIPDSVVEHKTRILGATDADPGPRFFYEVRNKLWLFTRSAALSPWETAVYLGASLVRWTRTIARSTDRALLWRGLREGAVAGLRAGPRSTAEVLSECGLDFAALQFIAHFARHGRLG